MTKTSLNRIRSRRLSQRGAIRCRGGAQQSYKPIQDCSIPSVPDQIIGYLRSVVDDAAQGWLHTQKQRATQWIRDRWLPELFPTTGLHTNRSSLPQWWSKPMDDDENNNRGGNRWNHHPSSSSQHHHSATEWMLVPPPHPLLATSRCSASPAVRASRGHVPVYQPSRRSRRSVGEPDTVVGSQEEPTTPLLVIHQEEVNVTPHERRFARDEETPHD